MKETNRLRLARNNLSISLHRKSCWAQLECAKCHIRIAQKANIALAELHALLGGRQLRKKATEAMQAYRNDQYLWWQVAEFSKDGFMIRTRPRG